MGVWKFGFNPSLRGRAVAAGTAVAIVVPLLAGCQQTKQVPRQKLIDHIAMIDFTGLKPLETVESVNVQAAVPRQWEQLELQSNALYTHQQWRSPSARTGVGVAHIRLPLPLSTRMVLWLAKREYTKKANDGRVISEWTDELGRPWFEAENDKYRVRGFVVVDGFRAWVIYFGHKAKLPPDPAELSLAARAATSIVPTIDGKDVVPDSLTTPLQAAGVSE
jgi:hypothetical protein